MNTYRMLGDQAGSPEARDLAADLQTWHDEMVMHLRAVGRRSAPCEEDCPHAEAQVLWPMALAAFGEQASALVLLRNHGTPARRRTMTGRDARIGS